MGATTGRPRRCGWFDAVIAKRALKLNGVTGLSLMKLDVLDAFDVIKVCVSYKIGKRLHSYPPLNIADYETGRTRVPRNGGMEDADNADLKQKTRCHIKK